jgi:tetratricopeptide (TPR) repeat protein
VTLIYENLQKDGRSYQLLGVANYRAKRWAAAIDALQDGMSLRNGGDAFDWLMLAMAHHQLGASELATQYYDQAINAIESGEPVSSFVFIHRRQLAEVRQEAESVMNVQLQTASSSL